MAGNHQSPNAKGKQLVQERQKGAIGHFIQMRGYARIVSDMPLTEWKELLHRDRFEWIIQPPSLALAKWCFNKFRYFRVIWKPTKNADKNGYYENKQRPNFVPRAPLEESKQAIGQLKNC
jgi:hypothetical protein